MGRWRIRRYMGSKRKRGGEGRGTQRALHLCLLLYKVTQGFPLTPPLPFLFPSSTTPPPMSPLPIDQRPTLTPSLTLPYISILFPALSLPLTPPYIPLHNALQTLTSALPHTFSLTPILLTDCSTLPNLPYPPPAYFCLFIFPSPSSRNTGQNLLPLPQHPILHPCSPARDSTSPRLPYLLHPPLPHLLSPKHRSKRFLFPTVLVFTLPAPLHITSLLYPSLLPHPHSTILRPPAPPPFT